MYLTSSRRSSAARVITPAPSRLPALCRHLARRWPPCSHRRLLRAVHRRRCCTSRSPACVVLIPLRGCPATDSGWIRRRHRQWVPLPSSVPRPCVPHPAEYPAPALGGTLGNGSLTGHATRCAGLRGTSLPHRGRRVFNFATGGGVAGVRWGAASSPRRRAAGICLEARCLRSTCRGAPARPALVLR